MKKLVSVLCAAGIYFGPVAIIQAEKPCPSGLWEAIPLECYLDVFISSSNKPFKDIDGFEVPLVANWNPLEFKRLKPTILQSTSHKEKVKPSEIKPRVSQTKYDDLPPPSMSDTFAVSKKSNTDGRLETIGQQEKLTQSHTGSKNKTFIYYPKSALTIHSGSYGALRDVISYLDKTPSARVEITVYTDSLGIIARNLDLARKRVNDIRTYLMLHDISDETITGEIQGATSLFERTQSEEISPLNHRVEIIIR